MKSLERIALSSLFTSTQSSTLVAPDFMLMVTTLLELADDTALKTTWDEVLTKTPRLLKQSYEAATLGAHEMFTNGENKSFKYEFARQLVSCPSITPNQLNAFYSQIEQMYRQQVFSNMNCSSIADEIYSIMDIDENYTIEDDSGGETESSLSHHYYSRPVFFKNQEEGGDKEDDERDSIAGSFTLECSLTNMSFDLSCNGNGVHINNIEEIETMLKTNYDTIIGILPISNFSKAS